ncbi:MAG: LuxR family transcriptional regulator [Bacteroidales bacterium]|nr:LuxR family transcriptional regulator [Bacteroidales bacterium]
MHQLRRRNERIQRKAVELQGRLVELGKVGDSMTVQERKDELADIARAMSDISTDVHLTPREVEVARLCAEGLFSKEIGDRMGISQRTVETHKNNIFRKLGINTTIELVRLVDSRKDLFGNTLGDHSADRTHS